MGGPLVGEEQAVPGVGEEALVAQPGRIQPVATPYGVIEGFAA
jgi:hypothetical protein